MTRRAARKVSPSDLTVLSREETAGSVSRYAEVVHLDQSSIGLPGVALRITMRADTYAEQSFARIERWTPSGWALVHSVLVCSLGPDRFAVDRERLLTLARSILASEVV